VLGNPDARHVEVPELIGTLDPEEAGTAPAAERLVALQQPLLAHHPLRPLRIDLAAELLTRQRGDHPGAVGWVVTGDLHDPAIERINDWAAHHCRTPLRLPIQTRPIHLQHAGPWRSTRGTGRRALSLPAPQCFPRDLELVGLLAQRPLKVADPLLQLTLAWRSSLPASAVLPPSRSFSRHEYRYENRGRSRSAVRPGS